MGFRGIGFRDVDWLKIGTGDELYEHDNQPSG
jgi:hypothetical protein